MPQLTFCVSDLIRFTCHLGQRCVLVLLAYSGGDNETHGSISCTVGSALKLVAYSCKAQILSSNSVGLNSRPPVDTQLSFACCHENARVL